MMPPRLRLAEGAVLDEAALLEAIIENIPLGLVLTNQSGVPIRANPEALRILGRESISNAFPDWPVTEGYHLDGRRVEPDEWPLARTLRSGEFVRAERFELATGKGRTVVEISTSPILGSDGAASGVLAVLQDVTLRERQERVEREFVTNAAHQLQSPLAAIVSAIEVLQSGAKETPDRDLFLSHVERESMRLTRLTRALLVLARAETASEAPRMDVLDLCPFLTELAERARPAKGVEVSVSCPVELTVITNRDLFEEIVGNLVGNAVAYTAQGRVEVTARRLGHSVELAVSDTGPGIPAGTRLRVFERFYRGESGRPGFGLGLAIVRAGVEALEGEVTLESAVGAGTTVRVRLPLAGELVES